MIRKQPRAAREWYRFENQAADPSVVDIHVIDFIGDWIDDYWGFGVTAKSFIDQLSKLSDTVQTIRVHVNSPGGDVFSAVNIANALRDQRTAKGRTVETIVEGLAASAASLLIMGGDPVQISDNGLVMIHNPWSIVLGNARELRKAADELDKVQGASLVGTYRWHAKVSDEEIIQMLDETTWLDADEAVAKGFATEKIGGLKAAATLDPAAVAQLTVPEQYRARLDAWRRAPDDAATDPVTQLEAMLPAAIRDGLERRAVEAVLAKHFPQPQAAAPAVVLRLCREGGVMALAEPLMVAQADEATVTARIAAAKEIRVVCQAAKLADLAEDYILAGTPKAIVQKQVTLLSAKIDRVEIDAGLRPDADTHGKSTIDTAAIYAARNAPQGAGR